MSYQDINVGETERFFTVEKKSDGDPIKTGTVNYYLKAKSGPNDGKWWRDSDQTWQAVETANPMTHEADGHWEIDLTTSPFVDGVRYLEYVEESGDLHIPMKRHVTARPSQTGDSFLRIGEGGVNLTEIITRQTTLLAALQAHAAAAESATLSELAGAPRKTVTDEGSVEERDLREIIAYEQYNGAQEAPETPLHGLRISRCKPAGPV